VILNTIWRNVYIDYQREYPNSTIVHETLKLPDIVKELKIGSSNEEGSNKATFQCDDMLGYLKVIDGHTSMIVLKRC
jgi:hypothetical protein